MKNQFIERPANKNSIAKRKSFHGVGINDADYVVTNFLNGKRIMCPYYMVWANMIKRCYSEASKKERPTYIGCSVCPEWLIFTRFKAWMIKQDWDGMQLDKDIINPGNKVYSPDGCAFVTLATNSLLNDRAKHRGKWPIGVSWCKVMKMFESSMRRSARKFSIGYFVNYVDAHLAYKIEKRKYLLDAASTQSDKRVADGLRRHAELLKC